MERKNNFGGIIKHQRTSLCSLAGSLKGRIDYVSCCNGHLYLPHEHLSQSPFLSLLHNRFGWNLFFWLAADWSSSFSLHYLCVSTSLLRPFFHVFSRHSFCCHNALVINLSLFIWIRCFWSVCIRSFSRPFTVIKSKVLYSKLLSNPPLVLGWRHLLKRDWSQHCYRDVRASTRGVQQLRWRTSYYFTAVSSLICTLASG